MGSARGLFRPPHGSTGIVRGAPAPTVKRPPYRKGLVSDDGLALIPLLFGIGLLPGVYVPLTRMAASGGVGRNRAAGSRTRYTQASDAAWVAGHAAALPRVATMVPVAVITVVLAIAVTVWGGISWGIAVGMTGFLAEAAVLISATEAANAAAARAAASTVEDPACPPGAQDTV